MFIPDPDFFPIHGSRIPDPATKRGGEKIVDSFTIKRPKFGNGPKVRHLFSYDIFTGIKVDDMASKDK